MRKIIVDLFRHMEWADATVWTSTLDTAGAADDAKLRDRLLHIHVVQRAFLSIWTGAAVEFPDPASFENLATICGWGRAYYAGALNFVRGQGDLDRAVVLPWSAQLSARFGTVHDTTLGETMMQVASHSTYHRGQVNTRLRELGCEPPLVDYIAWIWRGRPAAQWPDL